MGLLEGGGSMVNQWLALSYKVPSEPSRKRVYVWRKLKELGAVYLQQGVGVVPETDYFLQALQTLRREIVEMDGEAALTKLSFLHEEDESRLIDEFQALRNEEYDEIVEQCERVIFEIKRESEKGKFTYAEIEENEEELMKIQRWMVKIAARDFFSASGKGLAQNMMTQAAEHIQHYAETVYQKENINPATHV